MNIDKTTQAAGSVPLWKRAHSTVDSDISIQQQARMIFIEERLGASCEAVTFKQDYTVQTNVLSILDALTPALEHPRVVAPYERTTIVDGRLPEGEVFVEIYQNEGGGGPRPAYGRTPAKVRSKDIYEFNITVTGNRHAVRRVFDLLNASFVHERLALIKWWYKGDHGQPETRTVHLPPLATALRPEFYPDLSDPAKFLQGYLASDASVLLLAGAPGTGKTTLLRHLICDHLLTAHVIYDESLMMSDSVFQSFLFDADSDLLVIEDADTILAPREADQNKLMARFLNVSDGLIKLPNKKVVFTTNLTDFGRVDPALLRPGRCYGLAHTRALNLSEAQAAAQVAELPTPMTKGEYTLADLFNQGKQGTDSATPRRIGFSGR